MVNYLVNRPAEETFVKDEGSYTTKFLYWKGFIDRNGILASEVNADADAVTASWRTEGKNAEDMAFILDQFDGNGKESFKLIMNNLYKISKIAGDAYAEIQLGEIDDIDGEVPINLITLPPDNIKQIIRNGRIKRYEEINGKGTWKPEEMFHLAYNPIGAMTHGLSQIERIQNILIHIEQLISTGSKIMERYIKPTNVIYTESDSLTEMQKIKDDWKAINQSDTSDFFVPITQINKIERVAIPQGGTLDPSIWLKVLIDNMLMSWRVPDLALGQGYAVSEGTANLQYTGFRQMIRFGQTFLSENLERQLFKQAFPEDTPDIQFSFATEAQEEKWNRNLQAVQLIESLNIPIEVKADLQGKLLKDVGLIEKE